tara:strand:- start:2940 stop:3158 length:219 start_codon:yes stop_codon:yes gene_type:complete
LISYQDELDLGNEKHYTVEGWDLISYQDELDFDITNAGTTGSWDLISYQDELDLLERKAHTNSLLGFDLLSR